MLGCSVHSPVHATPGRLALQEALWPETRLALPFWMWRRCIHSASVKLGAKYLTRVSHNYSSWPKGAQEERLVLKRQCALHCFLPTDRWDLRHSQAPLLPREGPGETFLRCCKQRKLSCPSISEKPVTWILPPPSLVARDVPDRV